jgi:hypothetical protein
MEMSILGRTGFHVSKLGAGLWEIGLKKGPQEEAEVGRLLNIALDGGINFLDTAACYGISEELIGKYIADRRDEYILATKCGHLVEGYIGEPWTMQMIKDSIDRSLARMKTDRLDLLQLHSCSLEILEKGEVIQVLQDAQKAGKVRFIGYSEANRGDKPAALWSLNSGVFDTLQTSFNLVDQFSHTQLFPLAEAKNIGIIVKRPIALGVWGRESSPMAMGDEYFRRAQMMKDMGPIEGAPTNGVTLALGFVYSYPEVDTAILGTSSAAHMEANIRTVNQGLKTPTTVTQELERRFTAIEGSLGPI